MPVPTKEDFETTLKKLDEAIKYSRDSRIHQYKKRQIDNHRNKKPDRFQNGKNS